MTTSTRGYEGMTNADLIDAWLTWLSTGAVSQGTLHLRRVTIGVFAREYSLADATVLDVQNYLASRPGGAWSRASHLSSLKSFYRYANRAGLVDHDPTALAHPIRVPSKSPEAVPFDVFVRALASADRRTKLALSLGGLAGLRVSEIAALHADDIYDTHLLVRGKGDKERRVAIHPWLRPLLPKSGWAFPSVKRKGYHLGADQVRNLVEQSLGAPWTPHGLRRMFATRAYDNGGRDIRAVQELLGHASPTTTARYTKPNAEAMNAAVLSVA